jgi:hypothetical protein
MERGERRWPRLLSRIDRAYRMFLPNFSRIVHLHNICTKIRISFKAGRAKAAWRLFIG